MYQFKMPDIGEGTHESEITQWFFAEGDTIKEDDLLVEVQSDKVLVELPCPVSGKILKLYVAEGEMALVGSVIADIATDDNEIVASAPASAPTPATEAAVAATPAPAAPTVAAPQAVVLADREGVDVRTLAVPRVRKYARTQGVDLRVVNGTGNHGLITMDDVDAYLSGAPAAVAPVVHTAVEVAPVIEAAAPVVEAATAVTPAPASTGARREKMTPIRKVSAKLLSEVAAVPAVTVFDKVEVSALVSHRSRLKDYAAKQNVKLTYTPYFVKACVAMLKKHPNINGRVDMESSEFVYYDTFNIGVATNTDHGLFVPIIKDADRKSLLEVSREIALLGEYAKEGRLTSAEMSGGSMTVTNVGGAATNGVWSTPILNSPEASILGVGRFDQEFAPDEELQPVLKPFCKLSFTFDHRFIDGVAAQEAINDLKRFLNDPDLLLAEG